MVRKSWKFVHFLTSKLLLLDMCGYWFILNFTHLESVSLFILHQDQQ